MAARGDLLAEAVGQVLGAASHEGDLDADDCDLHATRRSTTRSQVIPSASGVRRARLPIDSAAAGSTQSRSIASATACGSGATTRPLDPSSISSRPPPESLQVIKGLPACSGSSVTYP